MLGIKQWFDDLTEFETQCLFMWAKLNGILTTEDFIKLDFDINEKRGSGTLKELFAAVLSVARERKFQPLPQELQYGITSALGKLIKGSLEDDFQSRTINKPEYKKQMAELLKPLGVDTTFLFSFIANINKEVVEETFSVYSNYWPFPPHKLDQLYTQLLQFQFIEPSGQFKAMFLEKNPPQEHRIIWKTNRTDLVYFGYRLFFDIYREDFINVLNKLFLVKKRVGEGSTPRDLKKSFNNILPDIKHNELKTNWKAIETIFKNIYLFDSNI